MDVIDAELGIEAFSNSMTTSYYAFLGTKFAGTKSDRESCRRTPQGDDDPAVSRH
jgi:hypothetical protein